ncbi:uncharacterized protein RCO7_09571 [Rhynchosporium graminicola]|uniref:Alkyl hydroperoxide reductase subunit C/ Thiol specific antioxidant domain-containing protein n=1 Tax=Rhynchosporium graminicola TaxID=2792576 RepID=A0A1E1LCF1_9HELO|nr:uncharacterized protein RCO7_09571 [Rhynchosporium commune]
MEMQRLNMFPVTHYLSAVYEDLHAKGPAQITKPIREATADHIEHFVYPHAIKVGNFLSPFKLSDASGKEVSVAELLPKVLYSLFFTEENDFVAKGVTLVAITCEVPKQALSTAEKNKLKFPVLSDPGNKCAGELGLLFAMPEILTPAIESLGVDLKERNGDDSFVLLVPQTLLVERMGVVRMEPDYYSKRAEPETVLEWIDKL